MCSDCVQEEMAEAQRIAQSVVALEDDFNELTQEEIEQMYMGMGYTGQGADRRGPNQSYPIQRFTETGQPVGPAVVSKTWEPPPYKALTLGKVVEVEDGYIYSPDALIKGKIIT